MPLDVSSTCAVRQDVKIVPYSLWYHHTYRSPSRVQVHGTASYMCDDTRGCIVQFWSPDDEHIVLETCRGMKRTHYKIWCIKLIDIKIKRLRKETDVA